MIVIRDNGTVRQALIIDLRVHKYYFYPLLSPILDSGNDLLKINRGDKYSLRSLVYQIINLLRLSVRIKGRISCDQNIPV